MWLYGLRTTTCFLERKDVWIRLMLSFSSIIKNWKKGFKRSYCEVDVAFTDPRHNHHPDDQTPRSAKARILKDFNINYTVVYLKFCQLSKETWDYVLNRRKKDILASLMETVVFQTELRSRPDLVIVKKVLAVSAGFLSISWRCSCLSESRLNLGALTEVSIKYLQELVRFKTNTLSNLNGVAVLRGMEENLSTLSCHKQLVIHWQDFRTRLTSFCI